MLIFSSEKTKQQETENTLLDTLLGRIAIGDTAALEALYRRTQTAVYSFALSVLKNAHDAEDVLHDCYVAAWNSAAQYHSRGKPMAWLITIAKNLCLQQLRAQRKTADMPEDMHVRRGPHRTVSMYAAAVRRGAANRDAARRRRFQASGNCGNSADAARHRSFKIQSCH